jgi:prepilin-type N-terminal cleavage/methylation domain-containing protein
MNSRGFTLIELAMVLVIIGLLMGGLLLGSQSMIGGANAKAVVAMVDDLRAATLMFRKRYGYLPGDWPYSVGEIAGITSGHGDGDGAIGGAIDSSGNAAANSEAAEAPMELFQAGMAGKLIGGRFATDFGPVYLVSTSTAAGLVSGFNPTSRNAIVFYGLPCAVATEADSKLDDGDITKGRAMGTACDGVRVAWFAVAL